MTDEQHFLEAGTQALADGMLPTRPTSLFYRIIQEYGDHKMDCAKVRNIEDDCSCGWSPIRTYLWRWEQRQ